MLEDKITMLCLVITELNSKLDKFTGALNVGDNTEQAQKTEKPNAVAAEITIEELQALATDKRKEGVNMKNIKKVITDYGYDKLSDVDVNDRAKLKAEIQAL